MSSPIPTANKNSNGQHAPLGMPKYVSGLDGVLYPIRTKLDTKDCWMLVRPAPGEVGVQEMILTPACDSADAADEDMYLAFLHRHGGWEMMKVTPTRQVSTGRDAFFHVPCPKDLTDPKLVLEAILAALHRTPKGGEEEILRLQDDFKRSRLRMTFKL